MLAALAWAPALPSRAARSDEGKPDKGMLKQIEDWTGGKVKLEAGMLKVSFARKDLKAKVDGWDLPPFMGLTSWATLATMDDGSSMVMADNVLAEDEVDGVMDEALASGFEVTALHHHFLYDEPRIYFMHVAGQGAQEDLARAIGRLYAKVKDIRKDRPRPRHGWGDDPLPRVSFLRPDDLEVWLPGKAQAVDGMLKLVFGAQVELDGQTMGADMGVNTWAAFAGGPDNAAVDGDFAVQENELQTVLKALRKGGLHVAAIHNHMTRETPRMLFVHYWGRGTLQEVAQAVKATLDAQHPPAESP